MRSRSSSPLGYGFFMLAVALATTSCGNEGNGTVPTGGGTAGTPATGGSNGAPTAGTAPVAGAGVTPGGGNASGGAGNSGSPAGGNASGGMSPGGASTGGTGGADSCSGTTPIASSTCNEGDSNCFSFFVASRARMFAAAQAFNGSTKGWGGDFRYGTPDGLTGADKLCTEIAEQSLPGNCRTWKAFLSTSTVDAISRVGSGPWYDRLNRTIANNLTELVEARPGGITVDTIRNNLPNEDGTPHHNEEAGCADLNECADNHDVLTGSDTEGKFCTAETCGGGPGGIPGGPGGGTTLTDWTCEDWTLGTSKAGVAPRCGHTWPTRGADGSDNWISHLTENGCAPGFNLVQNGGPMPTGEGSVGDGGGYGAIYCLALSQ